MISVSWSSGYWESEVGSSVIPVAAPDLVGFGTVAAVARLDQQRTVMGPRMRGNRRPLVAVASAPRGHADLGGQRDGECIQRNAESIIAQHTPSISG